MTTNRAEPKQSSHRVLVMSDTHLVDAARLPSALLELAMVADHIVHAGDVSTLDVISVLAGCAPLTAVRGNVESPETWQRLPDRATVTVAGVVIGVVHDAGQASGRHSLLRATFPDTQVCVYGHSHMPELIQLDDGLWVLNPGSPTQRRRAPFHSVIWLEVASGIVTGCELVDLDLGSS